MALYSQLNNLKVFVVVLRISLPFFIPWLNSILPYR